MSLIASASLWQNDDISTSNKKRISTMKKPEQTYPEQTYPPTIHDLQNSNEMKNNRVNELIHKMTTTSSLNTTDNKLLNFVPLQNPEITIKKTQEQTQQEQTQDKYQYQAFIKPPLPPSQSSQSSQSLSQQNYASNDSTNTMNSSNYRNAYQSGKTSYNHNNNLVMDNKLLEKINYMIHLLEEQQHEKTNNVTEEFILYTFFGIFIIYVLDSFVRTGKYTR